MIRRPTLAAGYPFAGYALTALEPYATKAARTVLRGRKLPGGNMKRENMETEIKVTFEKTFVLATYSGDVNHEFPYRLWSNIIRVCKENECFKVLGIVTSTKPPSTMEAFDHARLFRELKIDHKYRIAWVELYSESFKTIKFIETVLKNRGLPGKLFIDIEEAKSWLLKE